MQNQGNNQQRTGFLKEHITLETLWQWEDFGGILQKLNKHSIFWSLTKYRRQLRETTAKRVQTVLYLESEWVMVQKNKSETKNN